MPTYGYRSFLQAQHHVVKYLIGYYSQLRPHQHNGGISPNQAEENYWNNYKPVASFTWPLQLDKTHIGLSEMTATISVIIPTHKRPLLLKRAIQSVLDQTLQPMEIIIVDDAGCAESEAIVKGFNNELLKYIHNEDGQGASSSRNLG